MWGVGNAPKEIKKGLTMSYKTVLFDLDGTLLDTLADLRSSMNRALARHGFPPHTLAEVRAFVGNGIKDYTCRAVPAGTDSETITSVLDAFRADYKEHCADDTAPYAGILDMLDALRRNGVRTAVVSNKADFAVQLLSKQYFGDRLDLSRGEREGVPKKPAPDMVLSVMDALKADPASTLYVGDSDVDFDTAMNAKLDVVLVDWGFRDRSLLESRLASLPAGRVGTVVSTVEALQSFILS